MTDPNSPRPGNRRDRNTGRPLVEALISRGTPVRAMVRADGDRGRLPDGVTAFAG